jgi:vacuolar-type H+-ATPase subunit E/Vma4
MTSVAMANNGGTTPSDQIRQMVNFILQEAHEKANEIRVKVRNEYTSAVVNEREQQKDKRLL